MIVSSEDLKGVLTAIDEIAQYYATPDGEADHVPQDPVFLAERPHLLMALGYDEFRAIGLDESMEKDVRRLYGLHNFVPAYDFESLYRDVKRGTWYWYEGMTTDMINMQGPPGDQLREIPVKKWLSLLRKLHSEPDRNKRVLWLPSMWTPTAQHHQKLLLSDSVGGILDAVYAEQKSLQDIPWRQLEELVAELLRARGLQVSVTPRSRDGGRDIIARGELIPGEPALFAVEVKQKPVVGLGDVQRALRANEDFPLLMVATAGRFSAGVIKEKKRNRNALRLYLKDGIALTQWIHALKGAKQ